MNYPWLQICCLLEQVQRSSVVVKVEFGLGFLKLLRCGISLKQRGTLGLLGSQGRVTAHDVANI